MNPDALIEPLILEAAKIVKAGNVTGDVVFPETRALTVEEIAKTIIGIGWAGSPVVVSPTLTKLAEILRTSPGLYWHPLVERQISYLRRLQSDKEEWQRLGWQWHSLRDGEYSEYEFYCPPKEVAIVDQTLANLIEAHATGLLPKKQIQWKPARKQGGRQGAPKNPYPTWEPWSNTISAQWIHENFLALREAFKERLQARERKPSTKAETKEWYRTVVPEVLKESSGIWWSGLREYDSDGVSRWRSLDLDAALNALADGSVGNEGRPAFLSYAVLAALLDVEPKKIRSTIDNYRHPRRVRKDR
jgi:hypothetical protein